VPEGVTAGASGAVFGIYGVFIAFLTTRYVNKRLPIALMAGTGIYLLYTFFYGFKDVIDYSTIIGGFGGGLLIGYLFYFFHFSRNLARAGGTRISIEVLLLTGLMIFGYLKKYGRDDSLRFEKAVMRLNQIELKAMTQMQRLQSADNTDATRVLRDSALPEWRHFQHELVKTDKYTLDEQFKRKRKLLTEYADLRIKQTELIYKSVQEETDKYNGQIDEVSNRIDEIINQLGD
jgi:rhomboid protease GluP